MKVLIALGSEETPRKDNEDVFRCASSVGQVLSALGINTEHILIRPGDLLDTPALLSRIQSYRCDCVFNLFEGFSHYSRAEVVFAEILEYGHCVFTGNSSQALNCCLDKSANKEVLRQAGVRIPEGILVKEVRDINGMQLRYPVFLKPAQEDSSVGIDAESLCYSKEQCRAALERKLPIYPAGILLEDFIDGKEFNVSFIGRSPYEMLAVSALDYTRHTGVLSYLSYDSKWNEASNDFKQLVPVVQTDLPEQYLAAISKQSILAAQAMGCAGYFRVDSRMRGNEFFVLDVNPNPDINTDSGFARQAMAAGYSYEDVIYRIVKEACYGTNIKFGV